MGLLKLLIEILDRAITWILAALIVDVAWQFAAELLLNDFSFTETITTFNPNLTNFKIGIKLMRGAYWYFN